MKKIMNKASLSKRLRKILLIMGLKVFFLLCCIGTASANTFSQQKMDMAFKNESLATVLRHLKTNTEYKFLYRKDILGNQIVTVDLKNATIQQVLDQVLIQTGLAYEIEDQVVIIKKAMLSFAPEELKITGAVRDEKGNPLPGVTVILKGTRLGSTTDANGAFKLNIPKIANPMLCFSFIGMVDQEVIIRGREVINVVMKEKVSEMEEVVVTGIFERSKESFTGSSSTFTAQDLKMVGNANIIQSLKSLDPALLVMDNDMYGSDPNRLPDMDIRGKTSIVGIQKDYEEDPNQPLFILDGFETDLRTIMDLNMDRVESVTILKDAASTAIYGSKAANGVVVVETKRPVMGQLKFSYNGNYGISMPDLSVYNLMNATEKLRFEKLAGRYDYSTAHLEPEMQLYYDELYHTRLAEVARGVDSYWLSEPVRTGIDQTHRIYVDGGDKQMRYGMGLTYGNAQGVMKGSGRKVVGGNIDLFYRKDKFLFNNKTTLDYTASEDVTVPFSEFAYTNPYYCKRDENGEVTKLLELSKDRGGKEYKVYNPLWNYEQDNQKEKYSFKLTNNFGLTWEVLSSLKVRGRFGITMSRDNNETFVSPMHTKYENTEPLLRGSYQETNIRNFRYSGDANVTYGKLLKEVHQLNLVAGFNFSSATHGSSGFTVLGFPEGYSNPSFGSKHPDGSKPSYSESMTRSASSFVNGGYAYDNRYLMDFNYRHDGSSVFGAHKRFTNTWSVGVAWNLHNESFIDKEKWLNMAKFRFSVGNPGNQNFSGAQAITTYGFNNWMQNVFGVGNLVNKLGNPNLDWQKTWDYNWGLDLKMFENKLSFVFDYYYRNTDPLIISLEQPASTGVTSILTNLGQQINQGFTVNASYLLLQLSKQQLRWRANFTLRCNESRYEKIGDNLNKFNKENRSRNLQRYYDGASTTALWAVPSLGIDPASGREVFLAKDGTHTTTFSYDNEIEMGNSQPKLEGVIGTTVNYKKLDISLRFRYRLGGDVFNNALYNKVENISSDGLKRNQDKRALYDRWTTPGQEAAFKGISLTSSTPMSGRFIQEENTLSGESISVGYEFTGKWMKNARIKNLRLTGYMNDIFRISTVKRERGIDYPFARSISFALNVTF